MDKKKALILVLAVVVILFLARNKAKAAVNAVIPSLGLGTSGESFLGQSNLPRGIRNNNPGNLKISSSAWVGKVPVSENTDGVFEQFHYYAYGVRAMIKLIKNYIKAGYNTIDEILYRYAPPGDNNNTELYIQYVDSQARIGRDTVINAGDKGMLSDVIIAMAHFENGRDAISDKQFEEAWNMA